MLRAGGMIQYYPLLFTDVDDLVELGIVSGVLWRSR